MAHSRSAEPTLSALEGEMLLDLAELSIRSHLEGIEFAGADHDRMPPALRERCSAFVTLHVDGELNGCIGNVASDRALGDCVVELARHAAFDDPRLPPLRAAQLDRLDIEVSVLSPRREVPASTRTELIDHLRPGVDGLVLASGHRRALFLPDVWEQLTDPDDFITHLLRKAGLPTDRWPPSMRAEVFTTANVHRDLAHRRRT